MLGLQLTRMITLHIVGKHMQQLLFYHSGIVADLQKMLVVWHKTSHQLILLVNFIPAATTVIMGMLGDLEHMCLLIQTECNGIFVHNVSE